MNRKKDEEIFMLIVETLGDVSVIYFLDINLIERK